MRFKLLIGLLGAALCAAGCVSKVSGGSTVGVPFVRDYVEGRYQRPVDTVYAAALAVVKANNGTLLTESVLHTETNATRAVAAKVSERNVWIRVESLDPTITSVMVQTRTSAGGTDMTLAHELEKQIGIQLATR